VLTAYTDDLNPYKQWYMQRAFRLGWEAAEKGLNRQQAQKLADGAKLNRITIAGWRRGFDTQRGEY
jgi:hypothetical protein